MNAFFDMLSLFIHRRFYTKKQIEAYQLKKLKQLVAYAIDKSSYYSKTLVLFPFNTLDEYRTLPKTDKTKLMQNFDEVNTEGLDLDDVSGFALHKERNKDYLGYYKDRFVVGLSSGTSGNKGIFLTDRSLTEKLPFVFLARSGLPLSSLPFRILFCLRVFSQGFNDINSPLISLSYASTMTPYTELLEMINKRNINILMAPPSLLRVLLPYVDQIKVKLKRIVCFAEVLEIEEKQRFETFYQTKVIEIYQASEGQMASACAYGQLHINEDMVYVELLDVQGRPVQNHQIAHSMVVTNLVNRVQPIIRYTMNDLIVLKDTCPCGSHFRVIDRIIGRQDDVLTFQTLNGKAQTIFPDVMSRWIITQSDAIREFRVCLKNQCELLVELDFIGEPENKASILDQLSQRLRSELDVYAIDCALLVHEASIEMPKSKLKMKRFMVINE